MAQIIIGLSGGLGNQLFQFALGESLKHKGVNIKYDNSSSTNFRSFKLNCFNNKLDIVSPKEVNLYQKVYLKYRRTKGLCKIVRFIYSKIFHYLIIEKKFTPYDTQLNNLEQDCYLEGHWGKLIYFENITPLLRKQIVLKKALHTPSFSNYLNKIKVAGNNAVSIHVRRTDYLIKKEETIFNNITATDYYKKAINFIKKKITDPVFFIFSDDISWCKENLPLDNATYILPKKDMKDYHDFELIKHCHHHINANSTFSWWAAYLNTATDKTVIIPKDWYNETNRQISHVRGDMTPKEWIQL